MDYCFDTMCFVEPWNKRYPIDLFPSLWEQFDSMGERDILGAPREVRHEIEKIDDDLYGWLSSRPYLFREETESVQTHVRYILNRFPRLIDTKKNRSMADPWVIALALDEECAVVSEELRAPGSRSPKVPDVCDAYGVKCMTLVEFFRETRISFRGA